MECKGLCASECVPVGGLATELENDVITRKHGSPPEAEGHVCAWLKEGRCSVYEDRPLICRMWGLIRQGTSPDDSLVCPHGCKVTRYLSWKEAIGLWREAQQL